MVNIKNSIIYVKKHGDELEKARLNSIFINKPAPEPIQKKLEKIQNPDGGFSYWTKDFSTVSDTVYILAWLDDLQIKSGKIVDKTFDFLVSNQKDDGGWDEVKDMKKTTKSSDVVSGEEDSRVFLTAYCAHWFVRFGRAEAPEMKGALFRFLKSYRQPSGLILDDFQATWDSLVLFSAHPGKTSELFTETVEVVEKLLSPDNTKGSDMAYLLCCLRDAGLDAYHPFVNLCIDMLIQKQRDDGSWEPEYGEKYATNATLEALRVLKHYNVV